MARAFVEVLGNDKASKQIFNISGDKYVTFDGLARACAKVSNACHIIFMVTQAENGEKFLANLLYFDYHSFFLVINFSGWWVPGARDHSLQP